MLKALGTLAVGAATAVAAWALLPPPLGLGIRPIVVQGSSMAPTVGPGDLAVVLPQRAYRPGEIVAYRSRDLGGRLVLHRVIAVGDDGRLTLRGDANRWVDSYRPSAAEVIGAMKFKVPLVGELVLRAMGRPDVSAAMAGGVATLALAAGGTRRRQPWLARPGLLFSGLTLGMLLGATGGALLTLWIVLSPTAQVRETVTLERQAAWRYEGTASAAVYDGGSAFRTGDPLFLRIVPSANFTFDYQSVSPMDPYRNGSLVLLARLGDYSPTGWRRVMPLGNPAPIENGRGVATGVLDLARLQEIWRSLAEATGQSLATPVRLEIMAEATLAAPDGRQQTVTFTLPFRMDTVQAVIEPPQEGNVQPLLQPRQSSDMVTLQERPRELSWGPWRWPLRPAGEAGLWLVVCGGLLVGLTTIGLASMARTPAGRASLLGAVVARVPSLPEIGDRPIVRVALVADLVAAARARDVPVLADPSGRLMAIAQEAVYVIGPESEGTSYQKISSSQQESPDISTTHSPAKWPDRSSRQRV